VDIFLLAYAWMHHSYMICPVLGQFTLAIFAAIWSAIFFLAVVARW
jgi:hypothetical protein